MSTLDIAPLPLNALLIPTASNALLAIFGRTQILRKPSSPQTINSYQSNTGKLTNKIFWQVKEAKPLRNQVRMLTFLCQS